MITFEEAKQIALERDSSVNSCCEFKDAYRFIYDDGIDRIGPQGFIVLKEDGTVISFLEFIDHYDNQGEPKDVKFER